MTANWKLCTLVSTSDQFQAVTQPLPALNSHSTIIDHQQIFKKIRQNAKVKY